MFDLHLTEEQLKKVVEGAVFGSIDPARRDELVKAGIQHIMTPVSAGSYSSKKSSPLEDAFGYALSKLCNEVAYSVLDTPEIREQLKVLIAEAYEKMMGGSREDVLKRMVDNMSTALSSKY
ncbi:MAG: hypothetical protein A2Y38_10240 [Spirochaetes bacterium GWB1_59_5]|nr:MAG: hypothetical protein A2Y38_10240 [Spirochaetes bacterium GWB1_59_5]